MRYLLIIPLLLISMMSFAQNERKFIRQGNNDYKKTNYTEAEELYRKALEKKPQSVEANYNIGNVQYKQKKYMDAVNKYSALTNSTNDKVEKANIYYNLGNSYLKAQKLDESIKSYKESLRLNPTDKETKFNLAYAQRLLVQQQQQQKQNQNNKNNKDQKDNKDNKDNQDKKDQQQNKDNKQQQPQNKGMSQEDANRMLQAMQNDEKDLQKKLQMQRVQGEKTKTLKNW